MKRPLLACFLLLLAALPGGAQTTSRYLIGTKATGRTASRALQSNDEMRLHAVRAFDNVEAFAATLTADEAAALRLSAGVRYVTPVVERHLLDAPRQTAATASVTANDSPYSGAQTVPYGIDLVHARDVWPVTRGSRSVHVAVFDTGIDSSHPDLQRAYAGGYNTFDQTTLPFDDNKHGTHVSGTIAATDNNLGVVGVAPDTDLWMVKVLTGLYGTGTDENVVDAVDWLLAKKKALGGNWIVSMSFGAGDASTAEAEAIAKLVTAGVLPIAAAGNSGFAAISYPAAYPGVLSVGAVDKDEKIADFSSFGAGLGVVAPGVAVLSTVPVGTVPSASVRVSDGTSNSDVSPMIGGKRGEVTGKLVYCGTGRVEDFTSAVVGQIAFMERDTESPFAEKVKHAVAAGAIGAVIANFEGSVAYQNWTLIRPDCGPDGCVPYAEDANFPYPVVVALSTEAGDRLRPYANAGATVTISDWDDSYYTMSGTSMATPHVSGVAALLWALAPAATSIDVRNAIVLNAVDLGNNGVDLHTGWGLIDAFAAGKFLNPGAFGITTPPAGPHRRATHP